MSKKKLVYVFSKLKVRSLAFEWIFDSAIGSDYDLSFVVINSEPTRFEESLKRFNCPILCLKYADKLDFPGTIARLTEHFLKLKPDVVHAHLFEANIAGLTAARLAQVPKRIYSRHHSNSNHLYHPHAVYYDNLTNAMATDIVATCENGRSILIDLEDVPSEKIHIINFGLPLDQFGTIPEDRIAALRTKYDLVGKGPIIGAISRYVEWKGTQYIIPAFKEVLNAHPNAVLVMANAFGPYEVELQALLRELPPESYRKITFEEDISALYKCFDVFAHMPIDPVCEAFGQTYIESLASRVPSVFTLSGIAREFIRHEHNALVVGYREPEQAAQAMLRLLADAPLRARLAEQGAHDVATRFDLAEMITKLDRLYR